MPSGRRRRRRRARHHALPPAPGTSRAPAVVLAHGFGGSKDSVADDARDLAERGYVVLTYSARGFGAQHRADRAQRPALRDRRPLHAARPARRAGRRASSTPTATRGSGVAGGSYGGALALLGAALRRPDRRHRAADHLELPDRGAVPVADRRGRRRHRGRHPAGRATPASTSGCGRACSSASARCPTGGLLDALGGGGGRRRRGGRERRRRAGGDCASPDPSPARSRPPSSRR